MNKIHITQYDLDRLQQLLNKQRLHNEYDEALASELSQAEIVESTAIPPDVITMNSKVRFKTENDEIWEYSLVFPEDANIAQNKISIMSPVGCSLIGHKVGSKITLPTPKGRKELVVEEIIYQPERSGDLDL